MKIMNFLPYFLSALVLGFSGQVHADIITCPPADQIKNNSFGDQWSYHSSSSGTEPTLPLPTSAAVSFTSASDIPVSNEVYYPSCTYTINNASVMFMYNAGYTSCSPSGTTSLNCNNNPPGPYTPPG